MDIENYIKQLDRTMKEYDSIYHNAAVKYGLSDSAMWILFVVSDAGKAYTQQDLCRECWFPKQTINTALNNLIKDGCAELEAIPGTRNRKRIILTDKGRELAENTVDRLKKAEHAAFGRFTDEELNGYLDMSERINRYLREEIEKAI